MMDMNPEELAVSNVSSIDTKDNRSRSMIK